MLNSIFSFVVLFLISFNSFAEGPPWRKVSALGFNGPYAGIAIHEGDYIQDQRGPFYYEISTETWAMKSISAEEYQKRFSKNEVSVSPKYSWDPPKEFTSASGKIYKTHNEKCVSEVEGGDTCAEFYLLVGKQKIRLDVKPDSTVITNLNEINNNIWISFGSQGEMSMYGRGIQVYDGKTFKKTFELNELFKGGLRTSFSHQDPASKNIWVPHEYGLKVISPDFKTIRSFYFYTDFNLASTRAEIQLSRTLRNDNFFAELVRRVMPEMNDEVYEATKNITSTIDNQERMFAKGKNFVPEEYNVVVPIMLKAIAEGKATSKATELLCLFKDPRVIEKAMTMDDGCKSKFDNEGLLPKEGVDYKSSLLSDIKKKIAELSKLEGESKGTFPRMQIYTLISEIYENGKKLKMVGSHAGLIEINNFLLTKETSVKNSFLKFSVLHRLEPYDEILPGVKHVLKTHNDGLGEACMYFSPNRGHGPAREGAEFAILQLKAIIRIKNGYESAAVRPRGAFAHNDIISCSHSFRAQLMLEHVRKEYEKLSQSFTPEEKALSEKIQKGHVPEPKWKK